MCKKPVGDGAKRTRTGAALGANDAVDGLVGVMDESDAEEAPNPDGADDAKVIVIGPC